MNYHTDRTNSRIRADVIAAIGKERTNSHLSYYYILVHLCCRISAMLSLIYSSTKYTVK